MLLHPQHVQSAGMEIGGTQAERVCRGARPRRSRCALPKWHSVPYAVQTHGSSACATYSSNFAGRVGAPIVCSVADSLVIFFRGGGETTKKSNIVIEMSAPS